ncbi:DUF5414 family protein [Candidatus Woesearchaeota archaeon]|nr:DUF5414 family protein [Candidatus Woesearchaeota archaeon]
MNLLKKTLNSPIEIYYKGVEFMTLKKDKIYEIFSEVGKKIKGKISKKEVMDIEQILYKNLISKPLNILTFNDINRDLEVKYGVDVKNFIISILINSSEVFNELVKGKIVNKKLFAGLYKKFSKLTIDAKSLYDYPERWRLLTTDLIQSKEKGVTFRSRFVRYDNHIFSFESLPQDYFILINHFIKKLNEVEADPVDKFLAEINKLKNTLVAIENQIKTRQKDKKIR